ncbi:PAS domain-containing protein [Allopontixanthobacter sp.]|uniref:PAS domain-containing protein n=1 Tax=Allopontixanthobacter sp. TaxID=2906452 RepID=UPI002AB99C9B|nr:PAS domain-containing protein [Allopontixanthobacter sp.]MDZ4308553.1 PAS domain-containing protein [Allopontixanthobacter sp.]
MPERFTRGNGSTGTLVEARPTADSTEDARAQILASHDLHALKDDPEINAIVKFAAELCNTPLSTVSVVEAERQWYLAREGTEERETPRSTSFCAYAMPGTEPMVVPDATKDPRFADFPLVTGPEHVRFYAGAPLHTEDGTPIGALCVIDTVPRPEGLTRFQLNGLEALAQSVTCRMRHNHERREAHSKLETSRIRLRTILDSLAQIAWSANAEGQFDYFNARWKEVTGAEPPETALEWEPFIHPDDFQGALDEFLRCVASDKPYEARYRLRQKDGGYRWVLARARPMSAAITTRLRWAGTITDVDDAYRHSEKNKLLALELSHRIKNIFAVVSGLITLTSRNRPEAKTFAEELNSKIHALGRAHDFVRPVENEMGDSLHGLLEILLKPYAEGNSGRITVRGDGVTIGMQSTTPLALVFHEFATNAAKYGALSVPEGKVAVTVSHVDGSDGDDGEEGYATIEWHESGGPRLPAASPADPQHIGFGTRLVEMTVTSQLRGSLEREMKPGGFVARLRLPLSAL